MPDDAHERTLLLSARQKLTHLEWSDEEKEKIAEYFDIAVHSLCKICGIKREDVLYAVVHMDESMPHLHFAFLPMQYGRETYEQAKEQAAAQGKDIGTLKTCEIGGMKIPIYREKNKAGQMVEKFSGLTCYEPGTEERPSGCGSKRFKKRFLHELNGSLEREMEARGITTQIATGKGQAFRVREHDKEVREKQVLAERAAQLAEERAKAAEWKLREAEERARRAEKKQREAEEQARQAEQMAAQAQAAKEMILDTLDNLNEQMHGLADKLWKELADMLKELLGEFLRKIKGAKKKELDVIEKETKAQATEQAKRLIWKRFKPINDMVEKVDKVKKELDTQGSEMYQTCKDAEQETEYEME